MLYSRQDHATHADEIEAVHVRPSHVGNFALRRANALFEMNGPVRELLHDSMLSDFYRISLTEASH